MKQRGGIALTMVLWATSCIAMCAAGEETVAPDSASAGRPSEAIIYAALRPTAWDLVLVPADGSQPRRLTEHAALDYGACVSPDRRWVVFCSERSGNPDLYVIDLEGESPPRPLVSTSALEDAAAFSPDGEQLAYVSTASGNADVYLAEFDASTGTVHGAPRNLTDHAGGDFNPAFSPDGKTIAFASDRDAYKASEIYLIDVDGTNLRRVTQADGWDGSPVFAADGSALYFYSERDGAPRIYRASLAGGDAVALSPSGQTALSPAVLPSGRVMFTTETDGHWRLASVAADGTDYRLHSDDDCDLFAPVAVPGSESVVAHGTVGGSEAEAFRGHTAGPMAIPPAYVVELPDRELSVVTIRGVFPAYCPARGELASGESFDRIVRSRYDGTEVQPAFAPPTGRVWRPTWTPSGDWLAATVGPTFADPDASNDIWKFRPDGSESVNLTNSPTANDAFPYFSPDGKRIVFRSGRDGNHEIYLMNADGEDLVRLTDHEAIDTMPSFGPEGKRVAFTSTRDGNYEIYLLELTDDGRPRELTRLTDHPGRDTHPKFSPDGKWLVFASERGGMADESPLIPIFNPQPYGDIYALRLADGEIVRITNNKWEDGTPTWAQVSDDRIARD